PVTSPQTLSVTRQDLSGVHSLPNVVTSASGAFSFGDTPQIGGSNTYTVSWAGDAGHLATSAHGTVNGTRHPPTISLKTNTGIVDYQHAVAVIAHLGTTFNGRTVTIYETPAGQTKRAIKVGHVDSHGNLKAVFHPARDTSFNAVFGGDYRYASATA